MVRDREAQQTRGISDLAMFAMVTAKTAAGGGSASAIAEGLGASPALVSMIKAAVGATTIEDLGPYAQVSATFLASLRSRSIFAHLLDNGMARAPLRRPIRAVTANITGTIVSEGAPTPVSRITLASRSLAPQKAMALVVLSQEAIVGTSPAALMLIEGELRKGAAAAADGQFISIAGSGVSPIAATGTDAEAALVDLRTLLDVVNVTGASPALYWAMPPGVANAAATMTSLAGALAFPEMTPRGGEILGLPALVSDAVAPGTVMLIDAGGLVGEIENITIRSSGQAAVAMRDDPENVAAELVSLWQTNSTGILATMTFGLERYRSNAVAILSGVNWGGAAS
ncbi:hypothetical protein ASE63_18515 [Bosea sp. Root381]|nr:hypothetical protein ASE63_18515 [Bosea sp. Root381]